MKKLFQYNWMVRDEWFMICEKLSLGGTDENPDGRNGEHLADFISYH